MNRNADKSSERPQNPYERTNILSKYLYWWIRDFFQTAKHHPYGETDLYRPLESHRSQKLVDDFELIWNLELKQKSPSLLRALVKSYGTSVLLLGFLFSICDSIAKILQPVLLGQLIMYFTPGQTYTSEKDGFLYATGIIICLLVPVALFHPFTFYVMQVAMRVRMVCCSLMYAKVLKIRESAKSDGLNGQIINLMSNDVYKFDWAINFLNDIWAGPFQAIVISYLLYREAGISSIIGLSFLLSFIPLQAWLGKKSASIRYSIAEKTDERVHFMNEIIHGIQVIKMYTWEKSFGILVAKLRTKEIDALKGSANIQSTLLSFEIVTRVSTFLCLIAFVYFGNPVTARNTFMIISYFNVLNNSLVRYWPLAVTSVAEGYTSVMRIEKFLLKSDQQKWDNGKIEMDLSAAKNSDESTKDEEDTTATELIALKNVTAQWNNNRGLENISAAFMSGELYAIVGCVGAGKTTLFQLMLQELEIMSGEMTIRGRISYASQEPWLFEASVRDNIIFTQEFNEKRYKNVIRCCALKRDFELLPHGDRTLVGERGISLSGGQKSRINLARAVYAQADIYLLDDPLSAVDSHVGKFIYENCIKEFLHDKTRLLVTHQTQFLKNEKNILVLEHGTVRPSSTSIFNKEEEGAVDEDTAFREKERLRASLSRKFSTIDAPLQEEEYAELDDMKNRENIEIGSVKRNIYKAYLKATDNVCMVTFVGLLFIVTQAMKSGADYFVSIWVNFEENENECSAQLPENIEDLWNCVWTREIYIYIYAGIMFVLLYSTVHRSFSFFRLCLRASKYLHDMLYGGVTKAKMEFFNTNPSGRILNRFSKDIGSIDSQLPQVLVDCVIFFLELLGILIVITIINYWLLIPTLIVFIIFYVLRVIFLGTARSIKRVDAITRSPILSHVNATLQGLPTIRSMKAEEFLQAEFNSHQDLNTTASFLFLATTRGFAFWLDVVCLIYISIVILSFFSFGQNVVSGNVGLAVTQVISMIGMCNWGLRQTAELENQMTSVERIVEYTKLGKEIELPVDFLRTPKSDWPQCGQIEFVHLSLKYAQDDIDWILKDLCFGVNPMEKVGIVGRTGAGKSSILQALFHLAPTEGAVFIDCIDIGTLALSELRCKISIIPQDPILFSGSLKHNLDPFAEHEEDVLWGVLEQVKLKETVEALDGGLDSVVNDGGANFSMGQRQLVCLARAILRNNRILILDEATANVDPETDNLIQTTIRDNFINCTVLTIAHRLNTIIDSDRILVMDAGQIVEYGHAFKLLQNRNGHFYSLVKQTGTENFNLLMESATVSWSLKSPEC